MKEVDLIALAGLLHDIGKFGQRANEKLRGDFNKNIYGHKHSNYTAQILQDYFNDIESYHQASFEHHIVNKNSDINSWIVAVADRLASGFEREIFEDYNKNDEFENFKKQRLRGLFTEDKEYKIAPLSTKTIFYEENKSNENEYIKVWEIFKNDLDILSKTKGSSKTDLVSLDYLLKKHTTFMPSSTTFKISDYDSVKANIPLYDHLKATAIFAGAIYKLDNEKKQNLINYYKKTKPYKETKEFILINGDFFGIQDFIFNEIEAKSASKVLRGKSAFVQILTKIIAFYIIEKLKLSYLNIISENAGKFEILVPNNQEIIDNLNQIQNELNEYFVKEFFGETGVGISFIECGLLDFIQKDGYKNLRESLAKKVELSKLNKFDLLNSKYEINWDKELNNQNQCFACKKRVGNERKYIDKKVCDSCYRFIEIGKNLTKAKYLVITKDETSIEIFDGYYLKFLDKGENPKGLKNTVAIYDISKDTGFSGFAKWEISSYVATNENEILTFEELAKRSVKDGLVDGKREFGIEAIMSLKGDVDNMGKFLRETENISNSFAKFNFFSRMIDYFFSVYVPNTMREKYPNTYTIFAGGDDLFIIGAWDEVIELSKQIRQDFMKFVKGSPLSFSVGMILTKPNKPINFIARVSEEALENSKEMKNNEGKVIKDAISLFGETVKWKDYLDEDNALYFQEELYRIDKEVFELNTAFLYRLLELIHMRQNINKDITNTLWKSKINYLFNRNMLEKLKDKEKKEDLGYFLGLINTMIENCPDVSKMILSEFIYKRRD